MSNLTPEQIKRGRAFVEALRKNEKKAIGLMRGGNGGRCCLCVAYDVAQDMGANLPPHSASLPPRRMGSWYGWGDADPLLDNGWASFKAHAWNDGESGNPELSHKEIADLFEENFPQLKIEEVSA